MKILTDTVLPVEIFWLLKAKNLVVCIEILLVHECRTTAYDFDHFSSIPINSRS